MFYVYYTHLGYGKGGFKSLDAAITHAKQVGFDAIIRDDYDRDVARFSPIDGVFYLDVDDLGDEDYD